MQRQQVPYAAAFAAFCMLFCSLFLQAQNSDRLPAPPPPPHAPLPPDAPTPVEHHIIGQMGGSCHRETPKHGFLGVMMKETSTVEVINDGKETINESTTNNNGVELDNVTEGGAAATAGLQAGDIIVSINGKPTPNIEALTQIIKNTLPGDKIDINYLRSGKQANATAILKARPQPEVKDGEPSHQTMAACPPRPGCCDDKPNRPRLGIMGTGLDASIAKEHNIKKVEGIFLEKVCGAAAEAGLKVGDVLLSIDNQKVYSQRDVINILGEKKAGDKVKLNYHRNNKKAKTEATLRAPEPKAAEGCCSKSKGSCNKDKYSGEKKCEKEIKKMVFIEKDGAKPQIIINGEEMDLEELEKMGENLNIEQLEERISKIVINKTEGEGQQREINIVIDNRDKADAPSSQTNVIISDLKGEDQSAAQKALNGQNSGKSNPNVLSVNALSFFPNPNQGKFTLEFDAPETGELNIRMVDVSGKIVYSEIITKFSGKYSQEIDIADVGKGLYFLQISQSGKSLTKKVVVE